MGLDVLKGIGCVLMVVAHSKLKMWNYEDYEFWGNLAPALFFSVAGVTALFQSRKPAREMLLLYGFIFVLGFSYSGLIDAKFLSQFHFEIIQTIALGVLTVYFVERFLHPNVWLYLILGIAAFGLDKALQPLGWQSLEGILISPGLFPFIPWLSLFFLGAFAYRANNSHNLILFVGLILLYYALFGSHIPDVNESKWRFLLDFFLASSACLFLAFFLIRSIPILSHPAINWLAIFWGTYSLLFLYIHLILIRFFRLYELQRNIELIWNHPWLFWVLVWVSTTLAMLAITYLSHWFEAPFQRLYIWIALIALIFVIPFLPIKETYMSYLEFGLGVIFAVYYPKLGKLLKQDTV